MARPERHDADYFPFFAKRGKTLNILQHKYGLEGIGFFTNLLRFLSLTPDHYYCIKDEVDKLNFFSEIGIDENKGVEIIELLVKTGKLDKELWEKHSVIVSAAFLDSIEDAYKKRSNAIITIEEIRAVFDNGDINPTNEPLIPQNGEFSEYNTKNDPVIPQKGEFSDNNPQRKEENRIEKENKEFPALPGEFQKSSDTSKQSEIPKKQPLRDREPINDFEKVEKTYLKNWDILYEQKRVNTIEPVINWGQARSLLKNHFKTLTPEQIIKALKTGMDDNFVLQNAYSLKIILSSTVLNRLINTSSSPPIGDLSEKKSLEGLTSW